MAADTRQRMIEVTSRLLARQGYHGTGLTQVSVEAEVPKGSMYFHFPRGKEQLVAEAVDRSGELGAAAIEASLAVAPSALAAAERFVDAFVDELEGSGFQAGCPLACVALELGASSETVGAAVAGAFERWLVPLRRQLVAEGWSEDAAGAGADAALCLVEGAVVLAKARRSVEPLLAARLALRALLSGPSLPPRAARADPTGA